MVDMVGGEVVEVWLGRGPIAIAWCLVSLCRTVLSKKKSTSWQTIESGKKLYSEWFQFVSVCKHLQIDKNSQFSFILF